MADTVSSQTIFDGTRKAIMKFVNSSDGTGESAVTKVDVSALNTHPRTGESCTEVRIDKIWASIKGMSLQLLWDATANVVAVELAPDGEKYDYTCVGGLVNNAGAGKTGDVLFTTNGQSANDSYTITLELIKSYG